MVNLTVAVGWSSTSWSWTTGFPASGIPGTSIFSSRSKALVSRRWVLFTKLLNGVVLSNGGVVEFDDWCRSPSSAKPPGSVAILGQETNEVQNGRQPLVRKKNVAYR